MGTTNDTPRLKRERSVTYLILRPELIPVLRPGPRPVVRGADPGSVLGPGAPGRTGGVLHVDLETRGVDPLAADAEITTVAIANANGVWVWDPRLWPTETWDTLAAALTECKWSAFNVMFDGAWLRWQLGKLPPVDCCTFVLFRLLANEDWPGQRWSLERAQLDILEWPDTNKDRLQSLMWAAGFSDKGSMWRLADLAPVEYQQYCGEDADASRQLRLRLEELTVSACGRAVWDSTWQLAREEWSTMLRLHIEQQLRGVAFDRVGGAAYYEALKLDIRKVEGQLRAHPLLAPHVEAWEAALLQAAVQPTVKIKRVRATKAQRDQEVANDPEWRFVPHQAAGAPAWQAADGGYWAKFSAEISTPALPAIPRVNWESDPWLRWLLWGTAPKSAPAGAGPGGAFAAQVELAPVDQDGKEVMVPHFRTERGDLNVLPLTESGQMPVGKSVLPMLGEVGALLADASALTKRRGYVASYLAGEVDGVLHPRMRAHGTVSGRMAGGS